jgi:hypothetical protein
MTDGLCSVGFCSRPFPSSSIPPAWATSVGSTARTGTETGMMRGTIPLSSRARLAAKEGSVNSTPHLEVEANTLFRFSSEPLASWKKWRLGGWKWGSEAMSWWSEFPCPFNPGTQTPTLAPTGVWQPGLSLSILLSPYSQHLTQTPFCQVLPSWSGAHLVYRCVSFGLYSGWHMT